MSPLTSEILTVSLLILANGVFAMAEIAIVSSRRTRLQGLADRGSRGARVALKLADKPTEFLATIQIGISLVGVISGAYGGVTIGERLAASLQTIPLLAPHARLLGVGLVVVCITYLSLVIGELVPKRLALAHREPLAARLAPLMYAISRAVTPAVWFLTLSTNALLTLLRVKPSSEPPITDEELRLVISEGTAAGVFEQYEQDVIERLLRLDDRRLGSVMRPRHLVLWLDQEEPSQTLLDQIVQGGHSRYPVYLESPDQVVGVLNARQYLSDLVLNRPAALDQALEPAVYVPENASLLDGLEELTSRGGRLALVVDEYGSVQGIVTLNDIVQALVGGRVATDGEPRPGIIERSEGGYFVDGLLPVDEFRERFAVPLEDDLPYHTVAGLVMSQLGDIPEVGDRFALADLQFEVLDMDGHRVDKVLVTRLPG